jgi:two-component system LytT family response regulator
VSGTAILRALIAEDEPLGRRTLRDFLAGADGIECIGEAENGADAVRLIDALKPDLVFLDVKMPGLTGIQVIERIKHRPAIVFTTAYDRYAVSAFELEAVDYLVKPFGRKRFLATLERVRRRLQESAAGAGAPPSPHAGAPVDALATAGSGAAAGGIPAGIGATPLRRLFAKSGDRIVPIPLAEVVRFEAAEDYVSVHAAGRVSLISVTLNELETHLDPERFQRVHRAHIINLDHVEQIRPFDERRLTIILKDGSRIVASHTASQRLRAQVR